MITKPRKSKAQETAKQDALVGQPPASKERSAHNAGEESSEGVPSSLPIPPVKKKAPTTFHSLGLCEEVQAACQTVGWTEPTAIQRDAIPAILAGRDVIGVAQTGSGKTAVYVLPMVHNIFTTSVKYSYGLVLVPSRELAVQVMDECAKIGGRIGVTYAVILGGVSMIEQAEKLSQRPRILVATPGRLAAHLEQTRGFHLHKVRILVLDEADRMLDMDYEKELNMILDALPRQRQNILLSATLTSKVDRLHRATLKDPHIVQVAAASQFTAVEGLKQQYVFAPFAYRVGYLHNVLTNQTMSNRRVIIFCASSHLVMRLAHTLRVLGLQASSLMGKMTQQARLAALDQFRSGSIQILVCTDVAQRGIDIPDVDVVINFQLPNTPTDYIHRVGRTARIGRSGVAITFVTQFDIPAFLKLEEAVGKKMEEISVSKEAVLEDAQRVQLAEREATQRQREEAFLAEMGPAEDGDEAEADTTRTGAAEIQDEDADYRRGKDSTLRRKRKENEAMETAPVRKVQRKMLLDLRTSAKNGEISSTSASSKGMKTSRKKR